MYCKINFIIISYIYKDGSYEFLLNKIVDNVDNLEDKQYIADNIESIAESLKDFSLLFNKLISISINNKSYAEKNR